MMDEPQAVAALAALGQEHRLRIVRALITAGPDGLAAGVLAGEVGVSGTNLSFHLRALSHAGLIQSRRNGRSVIYGAAYPALSGLIAFLMRDCCQGRPEVDIPAVAAPASCRASSETPPMTKSEPFEVVIYHNPACGTSRNTLAMIRNAGIEPHVVEYLKAPPARALLVRILARAGLSVRDVLRQKGTPYAELGLAEPGLTDDALLDAIEAHPILLERPLVVTPKGVRLCRPPEAVLNLLPAQ